MIKYFITFYIPVLNHFQSTSNTWLRICVVLVIGLRRGFAGIEEIDGKRIPFLIKTTADYCTSSKMQGFSGLENGIWANYTNQIKIKWINKRREKEIEVGKTRENASRKVKEYSSFN